MALYAGGTLLHLARFRPLLIFESWRTPRSSDLPQAGWGTVPTSRCRRRHCRSRLFRRRTWDGELTVLGICTQVLGDCVNLMRGDFLRGGMGLLIAGVLLNLFAKRQDQKKLQPCWPVRSTSRSKSRSLNPFGSSIDCLSPSNCRTFRVPS